MIKEIVVFVLVTAMIVFEGWALSVFFNILSPLFFGGVKINLFQAFILMGISGTVDICRWVERIQAHEPQQLSKEVGK